MVSIISLIKLFYRKLLDNFEEIKRQFSEVSERFLYIQYVFVSHCVDCMCMFVIHTLKSVLTPTMNNSYIAVIGVHEMHGRMHPNYCHITILLVVDLCSPLDYFMMIHPLPIAGKLPIKTLVAKQLPTNHYNSVSFRGGGGALGFPPPPSDQFPPLKY